MTIISNHWHGKNDLKSSIWTVLALPLITLIVVHRFIINEWVARDWVPAIPAAGILFVLYVGLLCWQLVGIRRSSRRELAAYGSTTDTYYVYGIVCVAILFIVVNLLDVLTNQNTHGQPQPFSHTGLDPIAPSFDIRSHNNDSSSVTVQGLFGVAATRQLTAYLDEHPDVHTLVLHSAGGNIFEARGVGRLIRKRRLSTHVDRLCVSACTLAFVSGLSRTASAQAVFGFHAYRIDSESQLAWLDTEKQQQMDRQQFEASGVSPEFLNQLYSADANSLWYPSHEEMQAAGFLTANRY